MGHCGGHKLDSLSLRPKWDTHPSHLTPHSSASGCHHMFPPNDPPKPVPSMCPILTRVPSTHSLHTPILATWSHSCLSRFLDTCSSLICDLHPPFFPSPSLASLFVVPCTTPKHGIYFWSEELRCRVTFYMYRPLNLGEAKEPSSRRNHGLSVWKIVGKWISSMNQMKRRKIIIAGVVHWGSKHIPVNNCTNIPPRKRTSGLHNWGNLGKTTNMNR